MLGVSLRSKKYSIKWWNVSIYLINSEKLLNTEFKAKIYREQISSEMMKYPPNKRRTISDFTVMTSKF